MKAATRPNETELRDDFDEAKSRTRQAMIALEHYVGDLRMTREPNYGTIGELNHIAEVLEDLYTK